jgi:hypothetical protein
MRARLKDFMDQMGVGVILEPYGTRPWVVYDSENLRTCNAEVRMGPDLEELEAEIQVAYDHPEPGKPSMEQIYWMRARPQIVDAWTPVQLRVKGKDLTTSVPDWEAKCCALFRACVQALQIGAIPDFDTLIEEEMNDKGGRTTMRGGGSKAPKIKPAALLGMKKGGGF